MTKDDVLEILLRIVSADGAFTNVIMNTDDDEVLFADKDDDLWAIKVEEV